MNRAHRLFAILQVSAEAHGLHPQILGSGANCWWPEGLGAKINALRNFVFSRGVDGEDVVLFMDAFDSMVFGDEEDILAGLQEMEKLHKARIFFNAELVCYPPLDGLCEDYPPSPTPLRHLNSGLMIGRAWAWRELLKEPVPEVIEGSDQAWYQRQFRRANGAGLLELDRECRLLCAISDEVEDFAVLAEDGRMVRRDKGYRPPVVHWPGTGHWTRWPSGQRSATSHLVDTFRRIYPDAARRLVDNWNLELQVGAAQDVDLYDGAGLWSVMIAVLCVQCNVLGTGQRECRFFDGYFSERCAAISLLTMTSFVLASLGCLYDIQVRRGKMAPISFNLHASRVLPKPSDLSV